MDRRRFGWATLRAVAVALVVAATAVLVWTPFLSWGGDLTPLHRSAVLIRSVHPVPDPGAVRILILFGPVLTALATLLVVVLRTRWIRAAWVKVVRFRLVRVRVLPVRWRLPALAAVVAAVAAVGGALVFLVTLLELSRVDGSPVDGSGLRAWNAPPWAPVTVLAAATLALGWALLVPMLAIGRVRAVRRMWTGVTVVTVLAVFAGLGAVGAVAYGTRLGVDHRTAQPLPDLPPGTPGRHVWTAASEGPATVVGRYVVTAVSDGIVVRDAATGREHWHYRRQMLAHPPEAGYQLTIAPTTPHFGISADRRTVVTLWPRPARADVLAGFDLATGRLLWTRGHTVPLPGLTRQMSILSQIGDTAIVGRGPAAEAVDVRTGATWRWQPRPGCRTERLVPALEMLVAAVACGRDISEIVGVSAVDGTERWSWQPPSAPSYDDTIEVVGSSVRVMVPPRGDVTLDAATGAVRDPQPATAPHGDAVLRGPDVTVYLHTSDWDPMITGVDEAGRVRWENPLLQLAGAVVTGRAVRGGTGYALLVVPSSPASSPPSVAYERHLLTLDLATGDVLGFRPVSLPSECLCRVYPDDDVVLVPLADAGPVAVQFAARPGPDDRSRFGLAIYT